MQQINKERRSIAVKCSGTRRLLLGAFLAGAGIGTLLTFWSQVISHDHLWSQVISHEHHWSVYATGAALTGVLFLALLLLLRTTVHGRRRVEQKAAMDLESYSRMRSVAETALRKTETLLGLLTDSIEDVFWIRDEDENRIIYVSPAYETIWEQKTDLLLADQAAWLLSVHPDDRERLDHAYHMHIQGRPYDETFRLLRSDGSLRWIRARIFPIKGHQTPHLRAGIAQDITDTVALKDALAASYQELEGRVVDRTAALAATNESLLCETAERIGSQQSLKENEKRLTSILKNIDIGVWSIDATPARQILFLSPAFEHIVGVPLEEIRGDMNHWINYYHPDDRQGVLAATTKLTDHGHCNHDARVLRPDGQVRWVNFRGWAHVDTKGNIDRYDGITQDLTDKEQARQALQETENRFRLVADTAPVMICLKDREGKCIFLNKAWQDYTGQRENEWLGDGWQQPIHPDDLRLILVTVDTATAQQAPFELEFRLLRANGTYGWVLNRGTPRFLDDGTFEGLADSFLDITEKKFEERREQILSRLARALSRATTRLELAQVVAAITGEIWTWDVFFMAGRRNGDTCLEVLLKVETENGVKKERSGAGEIWEGGRVTTLGLNTSILVTNSDSQDSTLELVSLDEKHPRPSKVLFAPIQAEADILGVISLQSATQDFFSEADAALLERIAKAVGPALRRALSAEAIQTSELRLRSIGDSTRDAIITSDMEGKVTSWNKAAQIMFGYAEEEMVGSPMTLIMPERFRESHKRGMQRVRHTGESHVVGKLLEFHGLRRDGTEFPLELSSSSWQHAGETYITGVIRDLTERKQAESLLQAKELAERASEAKNFFLSRMSHELRTPMNAILGFARLMQMDKLSPTHSESIGEILKAGRHLLNLINEVLDISRIEAGQLSLSVEPMLLAEVIGEVCSLVQPLALKRNITIDCSGISPTATVLADKHRLKQVLLNLVANAIKYNREEGSVTCGCHAASDERVRITVADTGAGMPPEHLLRLFRPFDRLGADQTEIEGTGLGLALSHRLVELMGGETGVESEVGVGTSFWVELQAAQAPELENVVFGAAMEHPPQQEGPRGTVLYVEDDLSNLRLVEKIMARRPNLRLITAIQGQQGIDLATEFGPDMILLDLDLPDMHGSKVLQAIQADETTKGIPVIILSADATSSQIERLLAAGASAYLTKPLNVVELLNTIDQTLPGKGRK